MENNTIRYILADEVGLGKTIEAGMVIKELKARKRWQINRRTENKRMTSLKVC